MSTNTKETQPGKPQAIKHKEQGYRNGTERTSNESRNGEPTEHRKNITRQSQETRKEREKGNQQKSKGVLVRRRASSSVVVPLSFLARRGAFMPPEKGQRQRNGKAKGQ